MHRYHSHAHSSSAAPPPPLLPPLLSLVELPPPSAAVDGATRHLPAPAADEAMRAVASLAVREVPEGAEALHVVLKVEADGSLELHCDAVVKAEGGESSTSRLASVRSRD